ncbi:MAG: PAS domain-containing protein [Desulfobacterales bacterium]|nr:PAS domain-containing protein [Desulfobacterales bacterium]
MGEKQRREELEQRLHELERISCENLETFHEIFQSVNEFIFEHDEQGYFTSICPRFIGFLGYSRGRDAPVQRQGSAPGERPCTVPGVS